MSDNNTELTQLWEVAVDRYLNKSKRGSNGGSIAQKWKTSIDTQADLDKLIEQHEVNFSRFRSSRGKFWGVLMSTMRQLQSLGKVAQAGIGLTPFAPASVILEVGIFVIVSGEAVAETYDALETLFKRIKDTTDRLDEYLTGSIDHKLHKVVIGLLCSLLEVFYEAEAAIKRGRGKEMMRRIAGKENKIQSALEHLDEQVKTEIALITAKTYTTTQHIYEKVEAETHRSLLQRVLCADVALDNEAFGKNIESSRLPKSGDWILTEQLYDKWFKRELPVLWILGKPGTGKTYLASQILSYIRQGTAITSYFYIRESMNTQHTPEVALKTIAYQITELDNRYREQAIAVCKVGNGHLSQDSIWENLFVKPFSNDKTKPLFLVIDGIDEATPENQEFLVKIAKRLSDLRYTSHSFPAIQMLLLGRPDLEYNVSNVWQGEKRRPKIIHIQPSFSKADVGRFIRVRVKKDIPLLQKMTERASKRLEKDITKTLGDSSDGMFMLAKLMLAEVKDMNKPELIRGALAKPPSGLEDMFKRVITRVTVMGGFDKEDLNEIIMWIACAKRDLLLGELDLILKLRDIRQNGIVGLQDELRTRFGSFFDVAYPRKDTNDDKDDVSAIGSDTTDHSASSDPEESTESEGEIDTDSDPEVDPSESSNDSGDEEEDEEIPESFFVATVKFGHASIGQHFRTAPLHKGIGMDLNLAQAHIALTCLLFLTDNIPKKKEKPWRDPNLFQYSVDHFLDHLEEVNVEELQSLHPDRFRKLSDEVSKLFKDRYFLREWFDCVSDKYKFMCQLFSQTVCSRLRVCGPKLANGDRTSLETLFKPFIQTIAKDWLTNSLDPMLAVLFLYGFESTVRDYQPGKQWTVAPNRPLEHIAESISPEEIRQMASLSGLQKSMMWHLALGSTFSRIKTRQHLLAAVAEFRHATQSSGNLEQKWRAHHKEAEVLFSLGEYEDAITAASEALEVLPDYWSFYRRQSLKIIQDANLRLGNNNAAFMASCEACEPAPKDPIVLFNLIYTAHRTGQFSKTVEILRSLLKPENSEWGVELLWDIIYSHDPQRYTTEYMSIACVEMGQLDLARDAFMAVGNHATEFRKIPMKAVAESALARLYFGYYKDEERAIGLWEQIVKDYPNTTPALEASFQLAPLYFTKATESDPVKSNIWVSKLEELAELLESTTAGEHLALTKHESSALLGRLYSEQGKTDLARAKILPMMKHSIAELTDRDDSNDYDAYGNLAKGLICFGDRKNAEIAWAMSTPLEMSKELQEYYSGLETDESSGTRTSKVGGDADTDVPFIFQGRCDGGCNRREIYFKSWSMCELCVDVGFCDECLLKLLGGNAQFRICNPKHPFVETYPPRGLVTKDSRGYMVHISDTQVVRVDEWLGIISREWLGK